MIHFSYVAIQVTQLYLLKGSSPVALMRLCPKCSACVSVRLSLDPVLRSTALLANTTLAALLQFWNKSSYLTRLEIKGVVTFLWTIYESTKGAFVCCSVTKSVHCFAIPWTAARQASLSFTNSWSLLKLMSFASVMLSNNLTLCHPLLLLPSIVPSIRLFSSESALHLRWPMEIQLQHQSS